MSIEVLGVNRKVYDVIITAEDLIFLLSEFANIGIDTSTMIVKNALERSKDNRIKVLDKPEQQERNDTE